MNWVFHNITEFHKIWSRWDELNMLYFQNHPYLMSRFLKPLVKQFGHKQVFMAELRQNKKAVGMLLLEKKNPVMCQSFIPSQLQISPVLVPKQDLLSICHSLLTKQIICLRLLHLDSSYYNNQPTVHSFTNVHCLTTALELKEPFYLFWKSRKKNLKKNIERYLRRLKNENIFIALKKHTQKKDVLDSLLRYGLLESSGWKGQQNTAIHPHNTQGKFYNEILSNFSEIDCAAIYELWFNGQLASSRLCIQNDKMMIILKTTYDESLKKYSPGRILLYKVLEKEFSDNQLRCIEFYTNASKDQIDWSTETREIFHMDLFRWPWLKNIYELQRTMKRKK